MHVKQVGWFWVETAASCDLFPALRTMPIIMLIQASHKDRILRDERAAMSYGKDAISGCHKHGAPSAAFANGNSLPGSICGFVKFIERESRLGNTNERESIATQWCTAGLKATLEWPRGLHILRSLLPT